jgi:serine protease Do
MIRSLNVLLTWIAFTLQVVAQDLPLDQIAKLGKAATGLVTIKGLGEASAFCVHPDGWFITNNHVIRDVKSGDAITIVMNPSLKTEKTYQASIVRFDRDNDLALLRIDGKVTLPALQLSPSEELIELTEIIAFGFPLGSMVASERNAYPAISINAGKVASLRRVRGNLHLIQVDAVLNPGNSGGPILNRHGKVVGIVVSGIRGTGINQAIPTEFASLLLQKPDVQLMLPTLTAETVSKPLHFAAKVISLQQGKSKYEVKLNIKAATLPVQTLMMKSEENEYRAQATVLSAPESEKMLSLTLMVGTDKLNVKASEDAVLKVDGSTYPLTQIQQYEAQPRSILTLTDGSEIIGPLDTKAKFNVTLLGQEQPIDLNKLMSLKVSRKVSKLPVTLSIEAVVMEEGKQIARQQIDLSAQGDTYKETLKQQPAAKKAATGKK